MNMDVHNFLHVLSGSIVTVDIYINSNCQTAKTSYKAPIWVFKFWILCEPLPDFKSDKTEGCLSYIPEY